jgi:hypothetical protein
MYRTVSEQPATQPYEIGVHVDRQVYLPNCLDTLVTLVTLVAGGLIQIVTSFAPKQVHENVLTVA